MQGPASTIPLVDLGLKLSALRLCKPTADEHMRRSLERHGQLTAVTAFIEGDQLQLVDGFTRLRASRLLGWARLRVHTLHLDEATATAAMATLHDQHGLSEIEEAWVVRSLCREHGLSQGAVAHLMRRHKSWVSRRLLLVERLDQAVQGDVRLGLLSPRSALAVGLLPRGNQRRAADLVMKRGMTTRQAESLVRRLVELDSDPARDVAMDTWPEAASASASASASATKSRPRNECEMLLADAAMVMRAGARLEVRLLQGISQAAVVREALTDLNTLLHTLSKTTQRALAQQDKIDATLARS